MINKRVKLTAGLLVAVTLLAELPVQALASHIAGSANYISGTTYSFSAGAHATINETVVLDDTNNTLYAGVSETDAPLVTEPVQAVDYSMMAVANVNEYVNIRAAADSEAEAVGKLYAKGVGTVLEVLDGWYKIASGNVVGYVSADYLIVGDEATCKAAGEVIGTITTDTLRLRKEASTEAGVYTLLSSGQTVSVLDTTNPEWVQVKYKTYTGYLSSEFVSVETVYQYAESKEEEQARLAAEAEAKARREQAAAEKAAKEAAKAASYVPPAGPGAVNVVNYAVQFVGNPYVYGGTSLTNGADCSGFVMSVYAAFGVSLPHSSYGMRSVGYGVSMEQAQPGDIICYSGHVGIYIGNGQIVHASNRRDGIIISNWTYKKVVAVRRIY